MAKYNLIGINVNAFCIIGYVQKAMKREHKSEEEIAAYRKSAESSDYDNLLSVSIDMIEKLNEETEVTGEDKLFPKFRL